MTRYPLFMRPQGWTGLVRIISPRTRLHPRTIQQVKSRLTYIRTYFQWPKLGREPYCHKQHSGYWANQQVSTVKHSYVLPTQHIHVFSVDFQTHSDFVSPRQHWFVFITSVECVYCAVRHEFFNTVQCDSRWTKWHRHTCLSDFFPCKYHSTVAPFSSSFTCCFLQEGQTREAWEPSTKECCFVNRGALDRNVFLFHFSI